MKLDFSLIKKHPMATGGAVLAGGLVLFLLMNKGGGSASTAVTTTTGTDSQLVGMQYQAAAQVSQQNFQLAYLQMQQQGQQNLASMTYNLEASRLTSDAALQTLGLETQRYLTEFTGNLQRSMSQDQYQYQLSAQASDNAAALQMATLQTNLTGHLADVQAAQNMFVVQTNATLQQGLANTNAQVMVRTAELQAKTAQQGSTNNLLGNIFGGLMGAFF